MSKVQRFIQVFIAIIFFLATAAAVPQGAGNVEQPNRAHPQLVQMALEDGQQLVAVIVQKADQSDRVDKLVEKLGGKITKDLHIINAFVAEVTAETALVLARNDGVRWVSLDAPVVNSVVSGFYTLDEFSAVSYSNNDGSMDWVGDWQELGESDGPGSGRVRISNSTNCFSGNCLRMGGDEVMIEGRGLSRGVNLAGTVSATLSFFYKRYVDENDNASVVVQVSNDGGGTWESVAKIGLYTSDKRPIAQTIDITQYANADTRVRFMGYGFTDDDTYIYFDNVQVTFEYPAAVNYYQKTTKAAMVHSQGITGQGITVAVIDSGIDDHLDISGRTYDTAEFGAGDAYGHGTHVAGIVGGDGLSSYGRFTGVAPGVDLINLGITDENGGCYVSDVVEALQWVYDNKETYNIRVVNMSLNSTVEGSYHDSPLNAAAEILWFNGVTIVVSVGNKGPAGGHNTSKTAPANDPFFIAVGASDEKGSSDYLDDTIGSFSSHGVTADGFSKPDIIAPGYNIFSTLSSTSTWADEYPYRVAYDVYIRLSGTSMAAPMVTGAVSLLLQDEPDLTPDQVKYRLLNTAQTIDGYPYLDAYGVVNGTTMESANTGLVPSQLLWTGDDPIVWDSVAWNSVAWNSVAWNSVAWNSVAWNSVAWNSSIELDGIFWGPGEGNGNGNGKGGGKK